MINFNVSFNSVSDGNTYSYFIDNYQSIAQECVNDDDVNIEAMIESGTSNLTLCSNCKSFLGSQTGGDDNSEGDSDSQGAGNTIFVSNILLVFCGLLLVTIMLF